MSIPQATQPDFAHAPNLTIKVGDTSFAYRDLGPGVASRWFSFII